MADQTDSSSQGGSKPGPETSGLPPNTAAGIAVLFSFISGIVFLVIEKKSAYVRFYAMQSTVFGVIAMVVFLVLGELARIPYLGILFGLLSWVLVLGCLILLIITLIKAFTGVEWEIPYIGKQARKFLKTTAI